MHGYVCVCARTCDFLACSLTYPPCYFIRTCFFVLTILHFVFCLYLQLTTQTSMSSAGFQPVIPASKWSEGGALDRATTGIAAIPARILRTVCMCTYTIEYTGIFYTIAIYSVPTCANFVSTGPSGIQILRKYGCVLFG
jgi:hypothetical protein